MSLKEIFCQQRAISVLQRSFAADKMAHAYIFAGIEGVGKFKTACELAKLLLCEKHVGEEGFADSCGACESCKLFEARSHPDFSHVYKELIQFTKDGKDKTTPVDLPIDVIREFLIEKVPTRPTLSKKKVFVISEAERLNNRSQNSLLKVLEEPPGFCTIILLCTRLEKLLATTKSRCRIVRFGPIETRGITEKLKEMGLEETKAEYFARLAQGSLGMACQWARLEAADTGFYETKRELVDSISSYQYADSLDLAQQFLAKSKEISKVWGQLDETVSKSDINRRTLKSLIRIIISALSDAMKLNLIEPEKIINFDQFEQVKRLAGRLSEEAAAESITNAFQAMRWIDSSVNEKLIFEQLLLNLTVSDIIQV